MNSNVTQMSHNYGRMIPTKKRLRGAIRRSTGLYALRPGACVDTKSVSRFNVLKLEHAYLIVSLYLGFSSGPPSTSMIKIGFTDPSDQ